jgi:hypothetical protein
MLIVNNLTIHDEIAIVHNKETGKISNKRKTNNYSSSSSPLTTTAKTKADAFTNTDKFHIHSTITLKNLIPVIHTQK